MVLLIRPTICVKTMMPMAGYQAGSKKLRWAKTSGLEGANQLGSHSATPEPVADWLCTKNWFHSRPWKGWPMAAPAM